MDYCSLPALKATRPKSKMATALRYLINDNSAAILCSHTGRLPSHQPVARGG